MNTKDFKKVVRIGTSKTYNDKDFSIFCEIEFKKGNLSISGVEGPLKSGKALGSCGQIVMSYNDVESIKDITPNRASGWSFELIKDFFYIWDEWHLNHMKAGCKHQQEQNTSEEIELVNFSWSDKFYKMMKQAEKGKLTTKEYSEYMEVYPIVHNFLFNISESPKFVNRLAKELLSNDWIKIKNTEMKTAGWVNYKQHPKGLLSKPCAECGYKYGSAWLREEVPQEVLDFLMSLPDTDKTPAWV